MVSTEGDGFAALGRLHDECLATAKQIPEERRATDKWKGVLFGLAGHELLAPMAEVSEITKPLPFTTIPGTKGWVLGIGNIRGDLLPIIDLTGFLLSKNIWIGEGEGKYQRVLVIRGEGLYVGLLVESVMGMKQYEPVQREEESKMSVPALRKFLDGAYKDGVKAYPVFRLSRLATDDAFAEVQEE